MLVSAIMPTANRFHLLPVAIESFLSQTWESKELIIVDDGDDPAWALVRHVPGVVYLRYPPRMSIGRKRNIACENAAGEVIAHFDDDDWSAPERLEQQVELMQTTKKAVVGYGKLLFWDIHAERAYQYLGAADYACGTTLLYNRSWWQRNHFQDISLAEDSKFVGLARNENELTSVDGAQMMVARIHGQNTSPQSVNTSQWPEVSREMIPSAFFTAIAN